MRNSVIEPVSSTSPEYCERPSQLLTSEMPDKWPVYAVLATDVPLTYTVSRSEVSFTTTVTCEAEEVRTVALAATVSEPLPAVVKTARSVRVLRPSLGVRKRYCVPVPWLPSVPVVPKSKMRCQIAVLPDQVSQTSNVASLRLEMMPFGRSTY